MAGAGEITTGRRWLSFAIVLALCTMGAMAMFKFAPVASVLIEDMGFDDSNIGLMMSMFSIIGAILAFPVGGILQKLGFKKCLLIIAGSLVVGGSLGAISTSVPMLLASRFIEGVANGFICVMCSASVPLLLPRDKQGLGMGFVSAYFPLGALIALNCAPFIVASIGWRGLWWVVVAIAVVLGVLVVALFRVPDSGGAKDERGQAEPTLKPMWPSIFLTALVMGCFGLVFGGAEGSFYPTFLTAEHGMDAQLAGTATSVINLMNVIFGPVAGVVADKIRSMKTVMVVGCATMLVLYLCAFSSNMMLVWVFIACMGVSCAFSATGIYGTIPVVAQDPPKIGMAMACVSFLQNIGIASGAYLYGVMQASMGWYPASLALLVPVSAVALVAALLVRMPSR